MAPDSLIVRPSSVMTGDLPSGCTAFSSGGARRGLGVALIMLDLIRQAELLEQPEDALRARIVEVMDDDHASVPPSLAASSARAKQSSGPILTFRHPSPFRCHCERSEAISVKQ